MGLVKPVSPVLQRGHPLANGLVGAWPFYEGAGGTLNDLSGRGNSGVFSNGPSWTGGPFGSALSFNAASSQSVGVSGAPLSGTVTNFSIWGWAYRSSSSNVLTWGWGDTNNSRANILVFSDGNIYWTIENGLANFPNSPFSGVGWHFFCMTFSPGLTKGYIDGVQQTLTPGGNGAPLNYQVTGFFRIGEEAANLRFSTGAHDAVGVSSRTLSPTEVAQLYYDSFSFYRKPSRWWETVIAGGATFNQSCLGSSAPVATLVRTDGKVLSNNAATVASLVRAMQKAVPASSVPVATDIRQTGKVVAGSTAPVASLVRQTDKPLTNSVVAVASLVRQTGKLLTSTTAPVATMIETKVKLVSALASASAVATLVRQTGKLLTSTTAPVATLVRQTGKLLINSVTVVASLLRQVVKPLTIATSPVVTMVETKVKLVTAQAVAGTSAFLGRSVGKLALVSVPVAASIGRALAKFVRISISAIANLIVSGGQTSVYLNPNRLLVSPGKVRLLISAGKVRLLKH